MSYIALSVSSCSNKGPVPITELGGDFNFLMKRMCAEKYILEVKKDKADIDNNKNTKSYKFGPRTMVELGRQQLVKSYFTTIGQPVDGTSMQIAVEEDKEYQSQTQEETYKEGQEETEKRQQEEEEEEQEPVKKPKRTRR